MGTIRFENLGKQYGGRVLFDGFTLELHSGQVAALIGSNGVGKTTLFKLIMGEEKADSGGVVRSRDVEVGYLPQEPVFADATTLRDAVAAAFSELMMMEHRLEALAHDIAARHDDPALPELMAQYDKLHARFETAGGFTFERRLNEILAGLGFTDSDQKLPVSALSGGQKCRAALARLLLQDATFLLLDEPTNHLDIDAVRWLEKFLETHTGGVLLISHDRYLLDRLAQRTVELTPTPGGARVRSFPGNYSAYVEQRDVQKLTQERQYEQDKAFIEKESAYIRRYMAGQRSRQAKGRLKRLERMLDNGAFVTEREAERRTAKLEFVDAPRRSQTDRCVVEVKGLCKAYDEKVLMRGLDFEVWTGQRLGITGPNGAGKSTLLKILLGRVKPDAGEYRVAGNAHVGYFSQDAGELDPGRTIIEEILSVRKDLLERDARSVAARFLFMGDEPFKRVAALSGGEQSRVRFMKLMLEQPDLLILDEPTNHLDIASREVLEESLDDYSGTVIAVSHDRYFLDRVVDRLLVARPEGWTLHLGNYSDYIEKREADAAARDAAAAAARRAAAAHKPRPAAHAGREEKTAKRGGRADKYRSPLHAMPMRELEAHVEQQASVVAHLENRFADPEVYKDAAAVQRLQADLDAARATLAEAEAIWLERADSEDG